MPFWLATLVLSLTGMALNSSDVVAQTRLTPNASEILDKHRKTRLLPLDSNAITAFSPTRSISTAPGVDDFATVQVNGFHFLGNSEIDSKTLSEITKPFTGKLLTLDEIGDVSEAVIAAFHRRGFFVARAIVPPQEIQGGIVTIIILEGRLETDGLLIDNRTLRTKTAYVRRILTTQINSGEAINQVDYERALLLVNDLAGVHVRARLYPGQEIGSARLTTELVETNLVSGNLIYDNFGQHAFGAHQGSASINVDNPFGGNNSATFRTVTSGRGMKYASGEAKFPMGADGIILGASVSWLKYKVVEDPNSLEEHGNAKSAAVEIAYPFKRSTTGNLYGVLKAERIVSVDEINTRKTNRATVDFAEATLHGDFSSIPITPAVTAYALSAYMGHVRHNRGADDFNTGGGFGVLEASLSHLQSLTGPFSIFAKASGQIATDNLDGSLKCSLGGPYSNRAYPTGEGSADQCLTLNIDLRYDLPKPIVAANWQILAFLDHSIGDEFKDAVTGVENFNYHLSSVGLAVNANWSNRSELRFMLGYQLNESAEQERFGEASDSRSGPYRAWLQAIMYF